MAVVLNMVPVGIEVMCPCMFNVAILLLLLGIPLVAVYRIWASGKAKAGKKPKAKGTGAGLSLVAKLALAFASILGVAYVVLGVLGLPSAAKTIHISEVGQWSPVWIVKFLVDFGDFAILLCGLIGGGILLAAFSIYVLYRRLKK